MFPWQPKSHDMPTISLWTRMLIIMKIGLKLAKLQSKVALFQNIISNFTGFYLNTPVFGGWLNTQSVKYLKKIDIILLIYF